MTQYDRNGIRLALADAKSELVAIADLSNQPASIDRAKSRAFHAIAAIERAWRLLYPAPALNSLPPGCLDLPGVPDEASEAIDSIITCDEVCS